RLLRLEIPEARAAVLAAEPEQLAIGAEPERSHRAGMRDGGARNRPAGARVPEPGAIVASAGGNQLARWAEGGGRERLVRQVGGQGLTRGRAPQPDRAVVRLREHAAAIGTERDLDDPVRMRHGPADRLAGLHVPEPGLVGRLNAAHDQCAAIGTEPDAE